MTKDEIRHVNKNSGGSTKTKQGRDYILSQASKQLKTTLNIQIRSYADLKTSHLQKLVADWVKQGIQQRTVNNRLAAIRAALKNAGREKFASHESNSNRTLWMHANGLSKPVSASRKGTHSVIPQNTVIERIKALPEPFRTVASLQLELGLRIREAVVCGDSLKTWQKQLKDGRPLSVIYGTKTGKSRDVHIVEQNHAERLSALLKHAIEQQDKQRHIIAVRSSAKHPAEAALRKFQRELNKVGFKKNEASHALRYAWARAQFERLMQTMGHERTALAALSLDLGHGDGRGRYCKSVYLSDGGMGASPHGD